MGMLSNPVGWFAELFGKEKNGVTQINVMTALSYPPVLNCVRKITGNITQMPFNVYVRTDEGASKATDHPAYYALKKRPNKCQTPSVWKEQMVIHCLFYGNGRSVVFRSGSMIETVCLMPDRTVTVMMDGEKYHVTKLERNSRVTLLEDMLKNPEDVVTFADKDVIHLPFISIDGTEGVGLLNLGKRTFSIGIESEKHIAKGLSKGFNGKVILEAPTGAFRKEEDAREFLKEFKQRHKGSDGEEVGMLREGVKATLLQTSARDSQLIEQRKFTRQDTALLFNVESILGDDASVSYNSLEQKTTAFLANGIAPLLVKWEEECNYKLLSDREFREDTHYCKFNQDSIVRTDTSTKMQTLSLALQSRIMTRNEVRKMLELNTVEGGDEFENPNIDVKQDTTQSQQDATDEPTNDTTAQTSREAAIRSRLDHMLGVERKRVANATTNKDYISWCDKFYAKWQETLGEVIFDLGGDESLAIEHCSKHKTSLLAVYDVATPEAFRPEIEGVTAGWSVDSIVKSILEDLGDV